MAGPAVSKFRTSSSLDNLHSGTRGGTRGTPDSSTPKSNWCFRRTIDNPSTSRACIKGATKPTSESILRRLGVFFRGDKRLTVLSNCCERVMRLELLFECPDESGKSGPDSADEPILPTREKTIAYGSPCFVRARLLRNGYVLAGRARTTETSTGRE
jgi:hypothetical protein